MRPHRGRVLLLAASSFVSGAVEAAFLVVITRAALAIADGDDEFGVLAGHSASLAAALGVAALLLGLRLALGLVGVRVSADLAVDVLTDARHRLADAYLHTSWAVQHREPSGRLQELLGGFAGLASGVVAAFGALMSSALTLLALIVVSFTINPIATLVVVVALVALGVVISPLRRRIRARARSAADAQLSFATTVSELGALGMEMQAFGVRDQFADRVHDAVAADARARRRALIVQGAMNPIYTFLAYGALLGGLALATLLGTGELGGAAAVMLVMMRSLSYGQQVQTSIAALSGSVPYVDMLDETMEQYSAERAPGGDRVIDEIGAIEVSSVTFAYHEGHDVLRDVSFRIEPGEVVGMIGPSGSGKSTLVQLLLGLREPASGTSRRRRRRPPGDRAPVVDRPHGVRRSGGDHGVRHGGRQHRLLPRRHRRGAHRAGGPPSAHRRRGRRDAERIRHRGGSPWRSAVGWAASATLHRQGAGG